MAYYRLYYHLVWPTDNREPLITKDIKEQVYNIIKLKAKALGAKVYEIGGIEDHVHLVVTIPPSISIAHFIGEIKGASSFHMNHQPGNTCTFAWERGYGVVSFRKDNLQQVQDYVRNQEKHHSTGKTWPTLERCDDEDDQESMKVKEESFEYDPFAAECLS